MITGGTSVNTIAQQAQMLYEFRSESRENMDYMEKMFLDVIEQVKSEGADVDLEVIGLRPCGGDVDPEKERALVERAVRAVSGVTGAEPKRHSGSTDRNIPFPWNPQCAWEASRAAAPIQGMNMWRPRPWNRDTGWRLR